MATYAEYLTSSIIVAIEHSSHPDNFCFGPIVMRANQPRQRTPGEILETTPQTASPPADASARPQVARRNDDLASRLKRALRPRPVTLFNGLIGSVTQAKPRTARAKISVKPAERHKPDPTASEPSAVGRRKQDSLRMLTGVDSVAPAARRNSVNPAATPASQHTERASDVSFDDEVESLLGSIGASDRNPKTTAARLFNPANTQEQLSAAHQLADLVTERLPAPANATAAQRFVAFARQDFVLHRLHQAFGSDAGAARAALESLSTPDANLLALKGNAFELARTLAATSFGYETLRAIGGAQSSDADPVSKAIRQDAEKLALRAASALIEALPDGTPRPDSAESLERIALAALQPHERPVASANAARSAQALQMKTDVSVPARATLAALQLAANPAAEPEPHLKAAYAAWRFGFTAEGPGTPLARTQERMFKLSRYARRASQPGNFAWLRRMFGFNKSPMSALAMGTGGASLRHPDDDLPKADVIWKTGNAFMSRAQRQSSATPEADTVEAAVRAATLEAWYQTVAREGWRDRTKIDSNTRKFIAARASILCGALPSQVKNSATFKALSRGKRLDVATLERWIDDLAREQTSGTRPVSQQSPGDSTSGAADAASPQPDAPAHDDGEVATLKADLQQLRTLERYGEVPLDTSTPQTVLENFKRTVTEPRTTYDVRLSDGGQFGFNAGPAELLKLPVAAPFFAAGPDAKLIHGRHATISGGSTATHAQMFVGSDRRWSSHLGVTAAGGINLVGNKLLVSGALQFLPFTLDLSAPKGVMARCRLQPLGTAPAGTPPAGVMDPWRQKMLSLIDATTASGPSGGLPRDAKSMWDALVHQFYKDPDVSINWMESKSASVSSALNFSAGARYEHNGYKVGPMGQVGGTKNWFSRLRRRETGPLRAEYASSTEGRAVTASATLVGSVKPLGHFGQDVGDVKSVLLPSAAIVGVGTTLLQSDTGVQWRIAEEDGNLDPALCFRDTTFTSADEYLRYADSRRAAWDKSFAEQPAGAATPEPMDEYLARVDQDATSGIQLHAERMWMKPEMGQVLNALRAMRGDRPAADGAPSPQPDRAANEFDEDKAISSLLVSDAGWDNRFLYSLEFTGKSRAVGPSFLGVLQRVTEVSHPHQLSVLRAERPVSPPDEQT